MRLRNIKNADEIINKSKYIIIDPKKYKNKFNSLFNNDNPIYIEIGMGKGNFIINNAITYPNINFIGIEKYASVLTKACSKLEDLNLNNLKIMNIDANEIDVIFNKEIDLIYLNFSDPWPKKRHANRRLSDKTFLNKYDTIFKDKRHIIMKTDNRKLFEYSIMSFTEFGYQINDISLNLYQDDIQNNIQTEYEKKFHDKGFPIYKIDVEKK
ncbi:MAG: tRNA (guanosine(46)-N7)-methyltransferase TrmB [Bacilli bacterium]|nr:tRNA (guanosine(46)-N7)-methyltransferase TrmB [Bacilli bacterium]